MKTNKNNKSSSGKAFFELLESRQLRSVSLPVDLGSLLGQTIGTASSQPALAANGVNRVVATTQQGVGLLDGTEVYAQRLNAAGNAVGSPIHVNQITLGDQSDPKVAIANDGSFVVSYLSGTAAYVRQFAADGTPTGPEQKVSGLLDNVTDTNIAKGTNGNFLVTYVTSNLLTGKDIYSRLFNADGTPATAATLLNSNVAGDQLNPTIVALPGGQYLTAFQSNIGDGQGYNIVMQRISSAGAAIGTNTIVNDITSGDQTNPSVIYNAAQNEVGLVYQTTENDGGDVALQLFNTDGTVKSPSQIVNTVTSGTQAAPVLGVTDAGTFVTSYVNSLGSNPAGTLTGTLTMVDGNGLNLGDSSLGTLGSGTANIPVVGGGTSSLLAGVATGLNSSTVSTQEISLQPLTFIGTSNDDTVVVLPGVGRLTVTMNGVTVNPTLGDIANGLVIDTGAGNDSVTVADLFNLLGNVAVSVLAGDGNDTVSTGDSTDTILGGAGDDSLSGGGGADSIMGGLGNDIINGGAGNDFLWDTDGTDTISGGAGIDTVSFAGLVGNARIDLNGQPVSGVIGQFDTLSSDIENAVGGTGADTIIGNDLNNILSGGAGNDTIDGGLGSDIMYGGVGTDTVSYATRGTNLTITMDGVQDSGAAGELDTIESDIENAIGGAGADLIVGNGVANQLRGGSGNDTLIGGNGNDSMFGDSGNDSLEGDNGVDYLAGLAGNDTIDGGHASDRLFGDDGNDFLIGGPGNDSVWAGNGADRVKGGSGNDMIDGDAGMDTLYGDTGADTLGGGDDNDILFGGTGKDSLEGDAGNNILYGQSGSDTLNGNGGIDTLNGGASRDTYYADKGDTLISVEVLGS